MACRNGEAFVRLGPALLISLDSLEKEITLNKMKSEEEKEKERVAEREQIVVTEQK